jgi:hypothetical protein
VRRSTPWRRSGWILTRPPLSGDFSPIRAAARLPGNGLEPILYATDVGELRLIVLDSTRPGVDSGTLGDECLAWLERELSALADAQP